MRRDAVARRVLWAVMIAGWPAVDTLKTLVHLRWGCVLSDGGASLTAACGLVLRGLAARGAGVTREEAGELAGLAGRVDDVAARVDALAGMDARAAALAAALAEARAYAGEGRRERHLTAVPAARRRASG